jgi:predicted nucleotidyltransferase
MSIAHSLFSASQCQLLSWLFGHPERSFHLRELSRLAGLGSASLQRELRKLLAAGLLRVEQVGNQRRYTANPDSPVFEELKSLVRKTLGVAPMVAEALAPLAGQIRTAYIYGSIAKGTEHAESDVDVMIVAEGLALTAVLDCLMPIEPHLRRKLTPTVYTPAAYARRRAEPDSFINRVLAQPTLPLLGAQDE